MADYCKASLVAVYSENADYRDPEVDTQNWEEYVLTSPVKAEEHKVNATSAAAITISTANYTAVALFAVKNLDATNYVTCIYKTAGGAATAQTCRIPAGGLLVLSDLTAATSPTLQASGADCKCKVFIAGT